MTQKLPGAVPEIPVKELTAATEYYRDRMLFNVDWIADALGLAGVSRGDCRMFLADENFRKGNGNVGPILIWLNLDGKNEVDVLYEEWNSAGAKLRGAPESKPWGLHEFVAEDLDGNLFRVFHDFGTGEGRQSEK